ncbi:MAG TPA: hypothetical protein DCE23_03005 [Firmicutes bacterium]|nr:hypothetical protein [Bacillota bacterium]
MIKYRVFETDNLLIYINDVTYIVKILRDCDELYKGEAYLFNGYVYPYLGVTDNIDDLVGIYKPSPEAKYHFRVPKTDKEKEEHDVDRVVELNPEKILSDMEKNSDSYVTKEYIETVSNSADVYAPPIEPGDDILKKIIKKILQEKQININNYKNKLDNKWTLTNLKAALTKKQNLSMKYFVKLLDILGADIIFTVVDNGTDKIKPLKDNISLQLGEERFNEVNADDDEF